MCVGPLPQAADDGGVGPIRRASVRRGHRRLLEEVRRRAARLRPHQVSAQRRRLLTTFLAGLRFHIDAPLCSQAKSDQALVVDTCKEAAFYELLTNCIPPEVRNKRHLFIWRFSRNFASLFPCRGRDFLF